MDAKLFSNMNSAEKVGWDGRTLTPRGSSSPSMRSGHFSDTNFYHSCFFTHMSYVSASKKSVGPKKWTILNVLVLDTTVMFIDPMNIVFNLEDPVVVVVIDR
ncbi:hypothetical protein DEO72_LG7g2568 [Vigna unguiculata]|uniref:Neprosin PEP catalytic domain-containing protein n=1 Tax=Vigna unguiculata TaxID=3917 RepID=A0A4D6MKZ2_VIGUN|nr:hypothetical protein DEO72_LG7g2568 [Vigna unguiculata]